jgi:hypothetical protein
MTLALVLDDCPLLGRQADYFMLQSDATPLGQSRLRRLIACAPATPAGLVPLQVRAVDGPGDEEGERLVRRHGQMVDGSKADC